MKKILAFVLAFAMILSGSAMVFAQPGDEHRINYYDKRVDPWSYSGEEEWVLLGAEDLQHPVFTYTEGRDDYLRTYMQSTGEREFQGWYDAQTDGHPVDAISPDWTDDIDLYAQWYDIPQLVDCSSWEVVEEGLTYNPYITISHEDLGEDNVQVRFTWYKDDADYEHRVTNAGIQNSDGTYTSYFSAEPLSAEKAVGEYRAYAIITKDLGNGEEYYSIMDDVEICYAPEGSVGYVDGVLCRDEGASEGEWRLFDAIQDGSTVDLLTDISNESFNYYYVFSRDVVINANGHSMKDVAFSRPVTVNNPGGSWELTLSNGDFEDDYFMSGGFVKVQNNLGNAKFRISFEQEIENPSGYYFLSGVDASRVSVTLSGYAAYNYGDNVGLIESTALPYAVEAERSEGLITKFEFFASLENAKQQSPDDTVYVVNYYNSATETLSNVYDCYETPDGVILKTLYRATNGTNTSFYLYDDDFVEQYNNGETIGMSDVQKENTAVLNCYLHEGTPDIPGDLSGVVIKNVWSEITSPAASGTVGPNLETDGAYYFTNENVVVSKEGKYTFIADGGSIIIDPDEGQEASKISVSVAGELSSLAIAEGVRCAVSAMPGYPKQTRIDYIENNGSLGISGDYSSQTNVKRLINSGVVKVYDDVVFKKEDCTESFTAIKNLEGGRMYLQGVYMSLAGFGNGVKLVGIENEGELQFLDTSMYIVNSNGSYGVGIENIGGRLIIGRPDDFWDYDMIIIDRGYGIKSCNYFSNEGEITIYNLFCEVDEDYNGASAGIKAEDSSTVRIKGGHKMDNGGQTDTSVEFLINGENSYGLDLGSNVTWSIQGSQNGVIIHGGKAAIKAAVKADYNEYISSGIYLSDSESPFDIYYSGGSSEQDLLPDFNYYFDRDSVAELFGYNGVVVRNAEADLVEYLESPYPQYEIFTLPCNIEFGYFAHMCDYYYGAYARTNSIVIEQPGRVIDFNGYNIFVENFDDYGFIHVYDGDLKLVNSSETYLGGIDGCNNVQALIDIYVWEATEEPNLVCDNIVLQNAEYDICSLEGGVVINSGIYYDNIDFGDGVNIINGGQFDNQSDPVVIGDWSHTYGPQDGFCVVLKGGQYTGRYERVEFEYSDEACESNSFFAKDANDTTALIPYGYELNAYDCNGNKIRKVSAADFVAELDSDVDSYDGTVITDKSITLDFTLGGTAAVCRVEKASYNPGGGSSSGGTKRVDKTSTSAVEFTDIPEGAYFEDAVAWAINNKVTNGTGEKTFSPYKLCTRAEGICFLYRAAKGAGAKGNGVSFSDVPADAYYKEALEWAAANGITGGTGEGRFSPDTVASREVFLTMLYRTACIIDPNAKKAGEKALAAAHAPGSTAGYSDVPEGAFAEEAIYWAKEAGVAGGVGAAFVNGVWVDNAFGFGREIDRAQTVTMLCRYFGK